MAENRFKEVRMSKNKSVKEVAIDTGLTRSLLDDLEFSGENQRGVSYIKIRDLAKYYGVTADYLMGLSDWSTPDKSIQSVCAATGLSQKAAENIQIVSSWERQPQAIESLSLFLESDVFCEFINALSECYRHHEIIADVKNAMDVSANMDFKSDEVKKYVSGVNERDLKLQREKGEGSAKYNLYQASFKLADYMIEKSKERWGDNGTEEHP